jgi:hypothetical protein
MDFARLASQAVSIGMVLALAVLLLAFSGRLDVILVPCILLGTAALVFHLKMSSETRKKQQERARRLFAKQKAYYSAESHDYRIVAPSDFPQLDHAFYDRMRSWFESQGFRFLGDFHNVTLAHIVPESRAFYRTLVSADGTILGAATHTRIKVRDSHRNFRTIEFETELSDGTFVTTSNAALRLPTFPGIQSERLSAEIPPDEILRIHYERLARIRDSHPDFAATKLETIEDIIAFQRRMHAMRARHRRAIGYLNVELLEETLGRPLKETETDFAAEIERLNQQERATNDARV